MTLVFGPYPSEDSDITSQGAAEVRTAIGMFRARRLRGLRNLRRIRDSREEIALNERDKFDKITGRLDEALELQRQHNQARLKRLREDAEIEGRRERQERATPGSSRTREPPITAQAATPFHSQYAEIESLLNTPRDTFQVQTPMLLLSYTIHPAGLIDNPHFNSELSWEPNLTQGDQSAEDFAASEHQRSLSPSPSEAARMRAGAEMSIQRRAQDAAREALASANVSVNQKRDPAKSEENHDSPEMIRQRDAAEETAREVDEDVVLLTLQLEAMVRKHRERATRARTQESYPQSLEQEHPSPNNSTSTTRRSSLSHGNRLGEDGLVSGAGALSLSTMRSSIEQETIEPNSVPQTGSGLISHPGHEANSSSFPATIPQSNGVVAAPNAGLMNNPAPMETFQSYQYLFSSTAPNPLDTFRLETLRRWRSMSATHHYESDPTEYIDEVE